MTTKTELKEKLAKAQAEVDNLSKAIEAMPDDSPVRLTGEEYWWYSLGDRCAYTATNIAWLEDQEHYLTGNYHATEAEALAWGRGKEAIANLWKQPGARRFRPCKRNHSVYFCSDEEELRRGHWVTGVYAPDLPNFDTDEQLKAALKEVDQQALINYFKLGVEE